MSMNGFHLLCMCCNSVRGFELSHAVWTWCSCNLRARAVPLLSTCAPSPLFLGTYGIFGSSVPPRWEQYWQCKISKCVPVESQPLLPTCWPSSTSLKKTQTKQLVKPRDTIALNLALTGNAVAVPHSLPVPSTRCKVIIRSLRFP